MRASCRILLANLAVLITVASAAAQSPAPSSSSQAAVPPYPRVRIGGLTYLQYDAELEGREGYNAFSLTRGYLNIFADLTPSARFRLTPDIKQADGDTLSGSLLVRLKYGYVEFDGLTSRSWLRLGLHQTPWLDFEESINRYRVQGTMFAEREQLIPGSADFGAGYFASFGDGAAELQAGVYNGEGYTKPEVSKHKSLQGRVTGRLFPYRADWLRGLRVSGYYNLGWYDEGQARRHGIVMASLEHQRVVATFQWVGATEQPQVFTDPTNRWGVSGFLEVREGLEGWAGILRIDRFDPDSGRADDARHRVIVGAAYWFSWTGVRIGAVVNDEDVRYQDGDGRPRENRLLAQMHVQF